MTDVETHIERIAEAGLLTEQEAAAFVLRELRHLPADTAADSMDITPNVVDARLESAKEKLESAEATRATISELRRKSLATECDECGDALTSPRAERNGEVICFGCSDGEFVMGGGGGAAGPGGWIGGD